MDKDRRPVLVLTRDPMNRYLHSVICAPIISTIRGIATEVALGTEAGLAHASVANFDNTFLLPRRLLLHQRGAAGVIRHCDPGKQAALGASAVLLKAELALERPNYALNSLANPAK